MKPAMTYEITGQVANVVFLEGLVFHRGELLLYYGTADSKIAVARGPLPKLDFPQVICDPNPTTCSTQTKLE
jgi:predicted GH43/DUF377 family glycosyl hydrolase